MTLASRKVPSALSREVSRTRVRSERRALKNFTLVTASTDVVLRYIDDRKRDCVSSDTITKQIVTLLHELDAGDAPL